MGKSRTTEQGYYKLKKANKWLHFSMNAWINLKKETGDDMISISKKITEGDFVEGYSALCDLVFAAMKAYDQEERKDIDYDIIDVRTWCEGLQQEDTNDLISAMSRTTQMPVGKTTAKK